MLLALRQLLQDRHLPHAVQEELSVFSGGTLHHVAKLLAHTLMYHATLVVSPKGRHILRLLLAGSCLADILPGTFVSSWNRHQLCPAFTLVRNAGNAAPMRACICAGGLTSRPTLCNSATPDAQHTPWSCPCCACRQCRHQRGHRAAAAGALQLPAGATV